MRNLKFYKKILSIVLTILGFVALLIVGNHSYEYFVSLNSAVHTVHNTLEKKQVSNPGGKGPVGAISIIQSDQVKSNWYWESNYNYEETRVPRNYHVELVNDFKFDLFAFNANIRFQEDGRAEELYFVLSGDLVNLRASIDTLKEIAQSAGFYDLEDWNTVEGKLKDKAHYGSGYISVTKVFKGNRISLNPNCSFDDRKIFEVQQDQFVCRPIVTVNLDYLGKAER